MTHRLNYPIASRKSPLALAQTKLVSETLAEVAGIAASDVEKHFPILGFVSTGDKNLAGSLADIGGKGLFTKEVEEALLSGQARFAVHSMKDMPAENPQGLVTAAIPVREDPRDAFISSQRGNPWDLPVGAIVGTASVRRQAQLLARRPDLSCVPLRGNVGTRLKKLEAGEVAGTFLAMAGLNRLGFDDVKRYPMAIEEMLPAVGQGALCVQARADDEEALTLAKTIACLETTACVAVERAFLAQLDGSCKTPIAGYARKIGTVLVFDGEYLSVDGANKYSVTEEIVWPDHVSDSFLQTCIDLGREAALKIRNKVGTG